MGVSFDKRTTLGEKHPISNRLTVSKGFDNLLSRAEAQIFAV